ncbi:DUF378 domain-containing protein [Sporolactobacillus inulinus]|jgi:uncharacterized membrane protein YuzA (DUF378 family)|uniref:Membrane protein n=1 Tax=Sporolactobacillus inulinus CASD TaxID=1069536 RepID=A0A0U1QPM9_9BACL|nr:DUF378 domain-containing protein [Sporolactobacillus inulinus]KLI02761.1 membrane protein [Sporolactobacillus inulinus CASD]GEB77250.1 putative membrane protein YuzA [Sporolactobacillus inulinus]
MSGLQRTCLVLLIIGGINWGLIGFFRFDLVSTIFGGAGSALSRLIYGIVGLCALYCLTILFRPSESVEHERETQTR